MNGLTEVNGVHKIGEPPIFGPTPDFSDWVRDEEALSSSVVIPKKLTMKEYSQLSGQEQLDWWAAGGELKV